jgi:hypothetical protein
LEILAGAYLRGLYPEVDAVDTVEVPEREVVQVGD